MLCCWFIGLPALTPTCLCVTLTDYLNASIRAFQNRSCPPPEEAFDCSWRNWLRRTGFSCSLMGAIALLVKRNFDSKSLEIQRIGLLYTCGQHLVR